MNLSILHPRVLLIGGAALFLASFPAKAATVAILNYDFSSPDISGPGFNQTTTIGDSTTVNDWKTGSTSTINQSWGLIDNVNYPEFGSVPAGNQFAYENVYNHTGSPSTTGSLMQTLSTNFISGVSYVLSVYVGNNSTSSTVGTYTLTLYDNGISVDTAQVNASLITSGTFAPLSLNYTAADAGLIGIGLSFTSTVVNTNEQANFNDVTLNYTPLAIPEPSSYALLGMGLGTVAFLLRFRQRRG